MIYTRSLKNSSSGKNKISRNVSKKKNKKSRSGPSTEELMKLLDMPELEMTQNVQLSQGVEMPQNMQMSQNMQMPQNMQVDQSIQGLSLDNIDPSLIHDSVPVGDMNLNYTNAFDPNMQTSKNNLSNLASLSQTTNVPTSNLVQQGGVSNNHKLGKLGMSDFSGFDLIE